jgi:hypothetical protein
VLPAGWPVYVSGIVKAREETVSKGLPPYEDLSQPADTVTTCHASKSPREWRSSSTISLSGRSPKGT